MTASVILAYGLPIILLIAGALAVYKITADASAEKRKVEELRAELIENQKKLDDHYLSKAAETDKAENPFRWLYSTPENAPGVEDEPIHTSLIDIAGTMKELNLGEMSKLAEYTKFAEASRLALAQSALVSLAEDSDRLLRPFNPNTPSAGFRDNSELHERTKRMLIKIQQTPLLGSGRS